MRRLLRRVLLAAAVVAGAVSLWMVAVWPPPSWWRAHWPERTAFQSMRAARLRTAGDTTPRSYRPLPLDSVSDWIEAAVVAAEDDAFFVHHGIDWRSLREALGYRRGSFSWRDARDRAELLRALRSSAGRRDRLRGASTITQQLAKNLHLSPSRNPLRKIKEAVIAYRLELALPKARILEMYLGVAELGPNLWGVEEASRRYFGRPAARVSLEQAALLAATLPHPLTSNPAHRPGRARWRQELILRRLRGEAVPLAHEEEEVPPAGAPDPAPGPLPQDTKEPAAAPATPPDTAAAKPPPPTILR